MDYITQEALLQGNSGGEGMLVHLFTGLSKGPGRKFKQKSFLLHGGLDVYVHRGCNLRTEMYDMVSYPS